jgi:hypothetical protein
LRKGDELSPSNQVNPINDKIDLEILKLESIEMILEEKEKVLKR